MTGVTRRRGIVSLSLILGLSISVPAVVTAQTSPDTLPVMSLDPLVVTGTQRELPRSRLPNSISVVDRTRLEESGAASVLAAVSEAVPGVFVNQRGVLGYGVGQGAAGRISIRGAGGDPNTQVLVMTDGRPQLMGLMGHPIPDMHLQSGVERVEVIRGPASVLYGTGALGGVVNVITRRHWTPGLGVEGGASYGSFGSRTFEAGLEYGAAQGSGLSVMGSSYRTDGHRPLSSFESENASVRGSAALTPGLTLLADFSVTDLKTYDPGTEDDPLDDNWVDILRGGTGLTLENHGGQVSGSTSLSLNFGRHNIHDGFHSHDYSVGFRAHQGIAFGGGAALTLGGDFTRFSGSAENRVGGMSFGRHHAVESGLFGLLYLPFGDRLSGTGGLRLHHHSKYGLELAPQVGVALALDQETTLRLHTARGFRSPTLRELYLFPAPTPDLEPERAWNHELSLLRQIGGRASLELTLYQMEGENQIRVTGAPPNLALENTGTFKHRGGEVAVGVVAAQGLDLDLSYGYLDVSEEILSHPRHHLGGGIRYRRSGITGRIGVEHLSGLYNANHIRTAGAPPVVRLPDHTVVSARLSAEVAGHLTAYLSAENLLDESYQVISGYPMPGRALTFGLRARSR